MKSSRSSFFAAAALALTLGTATAAAQSPYLDHYRKGMEAYNQKQYASYAEHMQRAIEALPEGDSNRPFVLYQLARAYNLDGRPEEAVTSLTRIFDEDIEGLMIDYWRHDPALKSLADVDSFQRLLKRVDEMEVRVRQLSGSVYLLEGAGCGLAASIGPDGAALVDTGYAPAAAAVGRALRSVADVPLRYLINSHSHEDHVAGNLALGKDAVRISHAAAREAMTKPWPFMEGVEIAPMDAAGLPNLTLDEEMSIFINGERIRVLALEGHTEGDLIVYFEEAGVVHMGDNYFPKPDRVEFLFTGRNGAAFLRGMRTLRGWVKPEDQVVSGHSPLTIGKQLIDSIDATLQAVQWLTERAQSGQSLEQILEAGLPEEWTGPAGERGPVWWARYLARAIPQ